jgi:DNA-binding NarL/FixJ family response regulator
MLEAISRGLSTKMISRELWISEKTVKFHLTNIYRKLGVHNRTGAMRYAYEHDLIAQPAGDDESDREVGRL